MALSDDFQKAQSSQKPSKLSESLGTSKSPLSELYNRANLPEQAPPTEFVPITEPAGNLDLGETFERGARQFGSSVLEAFGQSEDAEELLAGAEAPSIPSFRQIEDPTTLGQFITERSIESSPGIATTLGSAGIGFLAGGPIGAIVFGALGAGIPLLGEARREIKEEGGEGTVLQAAPSTIINTALDVVQVGKITKALGLNKVLRDVADDVIKEAPDKISLLSKAIKGGKDAAGISAFEGFVETSQELNNMLAAKFFSDQEVLALDPQDLERLKQAFAGGLAGGLGIGTTAATTGAAIDAVIERNKGKKIERFKNSAKDEILKTIQGKKKDLEETETVLQSTSERFNPFLNFAVFRPLQGESQISAIPSGPLPVGDRGLGPASFIHGHHIREPSPKIQTLKSWQLKFGDEIIQWGQLPQSPQAEARVLAPVDVGFKDKTITLPNEQKVSTNELKQEAIDFTKRALDKLGIKGLNVILGDTSETTRIRAADKNLKVRSKERGNHSRLENLGSIVGINFETLINQSDTKEEALASTLEIASHEVGHAIISQQWDIMPKGTQTALLQGYREWLTDIESGTLGHFIETYNPIVGGTQGLKRAKTGSPMIDFMEGQNPAMREYLTSFDEYAAQMMSKILTGDTRLLNLSEEGRSFFKRTAEMLKKLWNELRKRFKATPSFEAWVEGMFLRKEITELYQTHEQLGNPLEGTKESLNNVSQQLKAQTTGQQASDYKPLDPSLIGDTLDVLELPKSASDIRHQQDIQLGFMRLSKVLTPIQIAELSRKSGIKNPDRYMKLVKEFGNTKMKQVVIADEIAQKWKSLGKTKNKNLSNFIFEVSDMSDEKERRLSPRELAELREQFNIDDETFAVWKEIDQSFISVLDNIEKGLVLDAAQSFVKDPAEARLFRDQYLAESDRLKRITLIESFTGIDLIPLEGTEISNPLFTELTRIEESINALRNKNYFPRSRLGEYTIVIKSTETDQEWEGHISSAPGQTLGFYAFDSKRERDQMMKALRKDAAEEGVNINASLMDTEVFAMMGMPEVLIRKILDDDTFSFTDEQRRQLKDVSLSLSPGKKFLRQLKRRKGVAGFSEDAPRVYANYMMNASNHLARVEHSKSLVQALQSFDTQIQEALKDNTDLELDDLVRLKDYYRRHFDYLMKPDNDWAQLRSLGFLWYLGFNAKSALINLTQIPMVTLPFLSGQYGETASVRKIAKAYKDIPKFLLKKEGLAKDEMDMLQWLRDTGILDESMVMELAGMGEADVLQRSIPGWTQKNVLNKITYYGGAMFRMGEKFNRHVTGLAAYRLAKEKKHPNPRDFAREAIEKTQFEYAKWNRAEFMRGKKSVIFLFWQYMQHASFLFAGGEGSKVAIRMWLTALLIAGIEGLPFAKTLLEVVDLFGTKAAQMMGVKNSRVALDESMRDALLEITDKPDIFLRGMSSYYGLGPLHLLSFLGAPIPEVDTSGSLSFGSPVQFLDEAFKGQGTQDEELGKLTAAVLGPVAGIPLQLHRSMTSTDPDVWKNVERAMPVFAKNAMQGARWLADGKETFRGGGEFLNMDKPEHRVSSIMKILGFSPTRLSQKYMQVMSQQEAATYWTLRKSLLIEDYTYGITTKDPVMKREALENIRKHNKAMAKIKTLKGLAISNKDLRNSVRARLRSIRIRELGISPSKRTQSIFEESQRLFPVEQ